MANEKVKIEDKPINEVTGEAFLKAQELDTKTILENEKKVSVFIPFDELNTEKEVFVGINGVFYYIKKGEEVLVPESVAAIWKESYRMQMEARKKLAVTGLEG